MGFATEYIDHQNRLHDLWLWTFTQVAQAALAADNAYLLQRGDTYFAMVQTMQTRALETQWRNFWAQVAMAALAKQRGEQEREIEECYAIVLKRSGAVQAVPLPALITTWLDVRDESEAHHKEHHRSAERCEAALAFYADPATWAPGPHATSSGHHAASLGERDAGERARTALERSDT